MYQQQFSLAPAAAFTAHLPGDGVLRPFQATPCIKASLLHRAALCWLPSVGKDGKDCGCVLGCIQAHPTQHLHKVFPRALTILPQICLLLHYITTSLIFHCFQFSAPWSCGPALPHVTLQWFSDSHPCPQRGNPLAKFSLLSPAG